MNGNRADEATRSGHYEGTHIPPVSSETRVDPRRPERRQPADMVSDPHIAATDFDARPIEPRQPALWIVALALVVAIALAAWWLGGGA